VEIDLRTRPLEQRLKLCATSVISVAVEVLRRRERHPVHFSLPVRAPQPALELPAMACEQRQDLLLVTLKAPDAIGGEARQEDIDDSHP
jgi:hypothetical protein